MILRLNCLGKALLAFFVCHLMDRDERGARVIVIITNILCISNLVLGDQAWPFRNEGNNLYILVNTTRYGLCSLIIQTHAAAPFLT